ncbi:MAG: hypothetical protein P4M13_01990 [Alphaproteobacteria bacterium]|nr:hypothetical protein [Alphaproteobacteria bacterium]
MSAFSTVRLLLRRARRLTRSVLFYEHWMIGLVEQPIANALHWAEMPPVRWIAPFDKKRYLSCPFPWPGNYDTLMCENYDLAAQKGMLAAIKLDANGIAVEMNLDFPLPGRLSFPFLFMRDGIVYIMPESSACGRLEIFRWQEHDGAWAAHAVVFKSKPVANAVLFEEDGLFWIAYTDLESGCDDNLNLVYASRLSGPWTAHRANPVQSGREKSRNGGAVFKVGKRLYRPAQDCEERDGGALRMMEILVCTPMEYREREVTRIVPSSTTYPDGVHTLVAWGDMCLVDGMRLTFSPKVLWGRVKTRLGL